MATYVPTVRYLAAGEQIGGQRGGGLSQHSKAAVDGFVFGLPTTELTATEVVAMSNILMRVLIWSPNAGGSGMGRVYMCWTALGLHTLAFGMLVSILLSVAIAISRLMMSGL